MPGILNISEASTLALHAMMYLEANRDRKISTREIAGAFKASEAHLAKVMQRLVKAGMVKSVRGPKGGFVPGKLGDEVKILDLYELFEGSLPENTCLFQNSACTLKNCVFDTMLAKINTIAIEYMSKTTIRDIADLYKKGK